MSSTTWRKDIVETMGEHGESWDDVVAEAVGKQRYADDEDAEPSLDAEFYDGFGSPEGCHFTVWTAKRVYFPVCYDGAESVGSVPRDPCDEATEHVGSW